jgi:hypothetical protein
LGRRPKSKLVSFTEISARPEQVAKALNTQARNIELGLAPLRDVYGWPGLDWCEPPSKEASKGRVINGIRKYADRFEQPYLTILSTLIYSMAIADRMKFATGTLPDIEAIVSDWGTDAAEMAACSVRACSMAFFAMDGTEASEDWCRLFWRTNYQLTECEFA